jgi:hypothetical protein
MDTSLITALTIFAAVMIIIAFIISFWKSDELIKQEKINKLFEEIQNSEITVDINKIKNAEEPLKKRGRPKKK